MVVFTPPPIGVVALIRKSVSFSVVLNTYCTTPYHHPYPTSSYNPHVARSCFSVSKTQTSDSSLVLAEQKLEVSATNFSTQQPVVNEISQLVLRKIDPLFTNTTSSPNQNADILPVTVQNIPDISHQFQQAIRDDIGSSQHNFSLATLYPEFASCQSMTDVIALSATIAPCSFNIHKARIKHNSNPQTLNPQRLQKDLDYVNQHGLRSLLTSRFESAKSITLQPDVIEKDFQGVSCFQQLRTVAINGVQSHQHDTFVANQGRDCPTYPDSIADPAILVDHLKKLHDQGYFMLLPMPIILQQAKKENLVHNTIALFITRKADENLGRIVFNISDGGTNHKDNKIPLSAKYGAINPPQLGTVCNLIENAHRLYPSATSELVAIRRDIQGAFHHLRYSVESSLLCIAQIMIDGTLYGVISSVAIMGDQTVNYAFNTVSIAIDEMLATHITSLTTSHLPLSTVATDDIIAVGPNALIDMVHDKIGLLVGDGRYPGLCSSISAIKPEKDLRGSCIVILGWLFDVPQRLVWPNYLTFAKLIYCMFILPGDTPRPGQPISVGNLMLMGAHAMRTVNVINALITFSRGFLANIHGSSNPKATVFLTRRSCYDIYMWRMVLTMAFKDARVLRCSTRTPLLRMKLPTDISTHSRDIRSINAATLLAYSDACTGTDIISPGIGGYIPGHGWFGDRYSNFKYIRTATTIRETPINVLELIALIITASLAIQLRVQQYGTARGCHFHIFCDNVAAVAKARTHRSEHPIYTYLLYTLSYIQLHYGCTIGSSYLEGILNTIADATSRCFQVPQGTKIYKRYLRHLPRYQPLQQCSNDISQILLSFSFSASRKKVLRPITLEQIISTGL